MIFECDLVIDKDGILELLISNGENSKQPLNLFKANIKENFSYLRIKPVTKYNAPARGSTVTLKSNLRTHAKTIDAGSGYLCQMEPVAHFGIREGEKDFEILSNILSKKYKINPAGEGGEFETFVLDSPLFKRKLSISNSLKHFSRDSGRLEILEVDSIWKSHLSVHAVKNLARENSSIQLLI